MDCDPVNVKIIPNEIMFEKIQSAISVIFAKSVSDLSPDIKGVYAWYPPMPAEFRGNNDHGPLAAEKKVKNTFLNLQEAIPDETLSNGRYLCELKNNLRFSRDSSHEHVLLSDSDYTQLAMAYTFFCPPLYIGKAFSNAGGLKKRLSEELKGSESARIVDLLDKADVRTNTSLDWCPIKYLDLRVLQDQTGIQCLTDECAKFLEKALFWAFFPPLNRKKGN